MSLFSSSIIISDSERAKSNRGTLDKSIRFANVAWANVKSRKRKDKELKFARLLSPLDEDFPFVVPIGSLRFIYIYIYDIPRYFQFIRCNSFRENKHDEPRRKGGGRRTFANIDTCSPKLLKREGRGKKDSCKILGRIGNRKRVI